jgi:hypothetical protein
MEAFVRAQLRVYRAKPHTICIIQTQNRESEADARQAWGSGFTRSWRARVVVYPWLVPVGACGPHSGHLGRWRHAGPG